MIIQNKFFYIPIEPKKLIKDFHEKSTLFSSKKVPLRIAGEIKQDEITNR